MLNQSNTLRYKTSGNKNQKSNFCSILNPFLGSGSLAKGKKIHLWDKFVEKFYKFESNFSEMQ